MARWSKISDSEASGVTMGHRHCAPLIRDTVCAENGHVAVTR
jgi:hypothetical protein